MGGSISDMRGGAEIPLQIGVVNGSAGFAPCPTRAQSLRRVTPCGTIPAGRFGPAVPGQELQAGSRIAGRQTVRPNCRWMGVLAGFRRRFVAPI